MPHDQRETVPKQEEAPRLPGQPLLWAVGGGQAMPLPLSLSCCICELGEQQTGFPLKPRGLVGSSHSSRPGIAVTALLGAWSGLIFSLHL